MPTDTPNSSEVTTPADPAPIAPVSADPVSPSTSSGQATPAASAESLGEPKPAAAEGSLSNAGQASGAKQEAPTVNPTPDVAEGYVEAKAASTENSTEEPSPSIPGESIVVPPASIESSVEAKPASPPIPQPPLDSSGEAKPAAAEGSSGQASESVPTFHLKSEPSPASTPIPSESELLAAEIAQRKSLKPSKRFMKWLGTRGLAARRLLARKRLAKLMALFDQHDKLTRAQVEKILRVSLHTADSDLDLLEKEGRIKQVGTRGWKVFYTKA